MGFRRVETSIAGTEEVVTTGTEYFKKHFIEHIYLTIKLHNIIRTKLNVLLETSKTITFNFKIKNTLQVNIHK